MFETLMDKYGGSGMIPVEVGDGDVTVSPPTTPEGVDVKPLAALVEVTVALR